MFIYVSLHKPNATHVYVRVYPICPRDWPIRANDFPRIDE